MSDREWIAAGIRKLRAQSGRTLVDVASYCEVSVAAVSHWEHGRSVPSAVSLVRLARLFDVSLEYFERPLTG